MQSQAYTKKPKIEREHDSNNTKAYTLLPPKSYLMIKALIHKAQHKREIPGWLANKN